MRSGSERKERRGVRYLDEGVGRAEKGSPISKRDNTIAVNIVFFFWEGEERVRK